MPPALARPSENLYENGRAQAGRLPKPTRFFYDTVDAVTDYRFEQTLRLAQQKSITNQSRIVLFSDTHRGDGGPLDRFSRNKSLFLHALRHYDARDFTYIEVGDGDELWHVDQFDDIQAAHPAVFEQLHRFHQLGRLHLIIGNHDVGRDPRLALSKAGLPVVRGLRLQHQESDRSLFVTHGHQADMQSGYVSRMLCRYIGRPFQNLARCSAETQSKIQRYVTTIVDRIEQQVDERAGQLEQRILRWAGLRPDLITICGHTHQARFRLQNYYNTGECLTPGVLSGLEISGGQIRQIRWVENGADRPSRQVIQETQL